MYLRNTWYALARRDELGRGLTPLTVLGENVVAFRSADGTPVALEDACPHRKLPLSMGRREGDTVVCGYHGLTFNCAGACVAAPTQGKIPSTAKVKSYPVADKWELVWIWIGDPAAADTSKIIAIDNYGEPGWMLTNGDSMVCHCNYLYLADNLLDPSHVAWVHVTSFAAPGTESTPLEVKTADSGVTVSRWMLNRPVPPFYAPLVKFKGNCDRLQHYEVRYPGLGINMSIYTPTGQGGAGYALPEDAYRMVSYHFLTPVDATTTRYFWLQHRNTDASDAKITAEVAAGARRAFEEDRVILEAVQKGMDGKTSPHLDLALDAGALRFRRNLQAMIDREQSTFQA
jgi:phenylpropionate dioxygenase-like ring-hydroxylating dioxygenase large terminal subunit